MVKILVLNDRHELVMNSLQYDESFQCRILGYQEGELSLEVKIVNTEDKLELLSVSKRPRTRKQFNDLFKGATVVFFVIRLVPDDHESYEDVNKFIGMVEGERFRDAKFTVLFVHEYESNTKLKDKVLSEYLKLFSDTKWCKQSNPSFVTVGRTDHNTTNELINQHLESFHNEDVLVIKDMTINEIIPKYKRRSNSILTRFVNIFSFRSPETDTEDEWDFPIVPIRRPNSHESFHRKSRNFDVTQGNGNSRRKSVSASHLMNKI
jgi:hypothetical protein